MIRARPAACAVALFVAASCGGPAAVATPTPSAVQPTAAPTQAASTPAAAPTAARAALWSPIPAPADAGVVGAQWYAISMPNGRTSRAAAFKPSGAGPFPVVLVLHGTEGFKTKHLQLAKDLSAAGVIAVATCWYAGNYEGAPGIGESIPPAATPADGIACPGGPDFVVNFTGPAVAGLQALVAAVRTLPDVRSERAAVMGHSRGGVAALRVAAATPGIAAAVTAAGYPGAATGLAALASLSVPVLMVQGTADDFYPNNAEAARAFESGMRAAGKTVRSQYYDGAPHDLIFQPQWHADAVKVIAAFLTDQLAK